MTSALNDWSMMKIPAAKGPSDSEADLVLLENLMKATGCTLEEARSLMMADDDLDVQCEHTLSSLSGSSKKS